MLSVEMKDDRSEIVHYDFEDYPVYIRKALLSHYDNFEAPLHWHDDVEFIAVLQGEMNYNINGEIIALKQGEGVFVNSRQLHRGYSENRTECDFICILTHPEALCISRTIEQKYIIPILKNHRIPYIKLSDTNSWHKELSDCIVNIYNAKDDAAAELIISSLFMRIWSVIYKNSKTDVEDDVYNSDFALLKNMIGYIQKYYSEKITLDDIAAAGAVGQSKCCKLFDKYIGAAPVAYLVQYRLHQSTWYLRNTDMTVTQVAHAVGFSGSSYYAEAFRKRYGRSPTQYRKTP